MPNQLLSAAIEELLAGRDLPGERTEAALVEIMEGRSSEAQTAGFLVALRAKGETAQELAGLARTMRALAERVETGRDDLVDTAGTGGGALTFNVSTAAALVAAGAGCAVAKHGNRSATSRCGSADVLEALGVAIELTPAAVAECIERVGFGFMFAPLHHQATRHVVGVRKELGVRTIFNFLGPLTNPAGARRQVIGVSDPDFVDVIADAVVELGADRVLVIHSEDGLDELSISAPTRIVEVGEGQRSERTLSAAEAGLASAPLEAIAGGEPDENAAAIVAVLDGEPGPRRDVVLLNAGAAIYAAGRATNIPEGVQRATESIDSGAAREILRKLVEVTTRLRLQG